MQPNIATIPITEIFSETDGCPVCRMRRMLEKQYVEYTLDAMMTPDVRVVTNRLGFCHRHNSMMVNSGSRLANALILQTHIDELRGKAFPKKDSDPPSKAMLESIREVEGTCYVCDRVQYDILHLLSTVYAQFGKDPAFREQYRAQDYLCLEHYALVMENVGKKSMDKSALTAFYEATNALAKGYMNTLYDDISRFASMYDYRNRGGDYQNSKDSIERSVKYLTSYPVDPNLK